MSLVLKGRFDVMLVLEMSPIDKFNMSFQGIRRIREARRESPLLESTELVDSPILRPPRLNLDLKGSFLSNEVRTTRDSEMKCDSPSRLSRKASPVSATREQQKRILVGNFL